MATLLNHLRTGDCCELADGCRDSIYSALVPNVRRRNTQRPCTRCCCPSLSEAITKDPAKLRPWWWDGSDLMAEFYGMAAESVEFQSTPGRSGIGVLTMFVRFRAANGRSLAAGMRAYRNRMRSGCESCNGTESLQVADACPGPCDRTGGCGNDWITLHGLTMIEWTEIDDGSKSECVQPVVISWQTECPIGYKPLCTGRVCLKDGNPLGCDLEVCVPDADPVCDPCNATTIKRPARVYRGCYCRPLFQTASGCRIQVPASCGAKATLSFDVTTIERVTNLRVAVWRESQGWMGPWTEDGRAFYKQMKPAVDFRIPELNFDDSVSVSPWDGARRFCSGEERSDGVEGPLGRPINSLEVDAGESLVLAVYGDTANGTRCLDGVCVDWTLHELYQL